MVLFQEGKCFFFFLNSFSYKEARGLQSHMLSGLTRGRRISYKLKHTHCLSLSIIQHLSFSCLEFLLIVGVTTQGFFTSVLIIYLFIYLQLPMKYNTRSPNDWEVGRIKYLVINPWVGHNLVTHNLKALCLPLRGLRYDLFSRSLFNVKIQSSDTFPARLALWHITGGFGFGSGSLHVGLEWLKCW